MDMNQQIKDLRIKIDGLAQLVENSNTDMVGGSSQMYESYKALILAKAWLGKILEELGNITPYKNDGNRKTVEDIEPATDTVKNIQVWDGLQNVGKPVLTHIEKVDWLREEIKKLINNLPDIQEYTEKLIEKFYTSNPTPSKEEDYEAMKEINSKIPNGIYMDYVHKYLSEARFWLGFELQRIKESNG